MPITPGSASIENANPFGGGPKNPMWEQPPGTFRGDLINANDPTQPVHPTVSNPDHANNPHYNIVFGDGTKAAIIIPAGPAPST
jgi:hypothetical protein